jgi:N-acetylglucosamine-6-sulfatase
MALDESVGRIYELEARGLLNDTLIVTWAITASSLASTASTSGPCTSRRSRSDDRALPGPIPARPPVDGMALNIDMPDIARRGGLPCPRPRASLLIRGAGNWRTEFVYEYYWERDYPQTPTVVGLRTDQHSFMRYHGIWDLDELYDIRKDPSQMNNLMAGVRTITESGRLFQRITDPELKKSVASFEDRIRAILEATGGRMEPTCVVTGLYLGLPCGTHVE